MAVSNSEQLPEDVQVRPKQAAADCDFNVILNWGQIVALKTQVNIQSDNAVKIHSGYTLT